MFFLNIKVIEFKEDGNGELFSYPCLYFPEGKLPRGTGSVGAVQPAMGGPRFQNFPWSLIPAWPSCSFLFSSVIEDIVVACFMSHGAEKKWGRGKKKKGHV